MKRVDQIIFVAVYLLLGRLTSTQDCILTTLRDDQHKELDAHGLRHTAVRIDTRDMNSHPKRVRAKSAKTGARLRVVCNTLQKRRTQA